MARPPSDTIKDLVGRIVGVQTNTSHYNYPRFGITLEEAWKQLRVSIENMREKLGEQRTDQLLDMSDQAQQHYRDGYHQSPAGKPAPGTPGADDIRLGTRLMQDIEWVVRGRESFAYPRELYRWPLIAGSRLAGDPDLERDLAENGD